MEPKNHKVVNNFLTIDEINPIIDWISKLNHLGGGANHHLNELSKGLNGKSFIFDISKTEITKYITNFQSITEVCNDNLPHFIHKIIDRLSNLFEIPTNHIFLQAVDMGKGGKINPHYDASVEGFINFKCNISLLSEDFFIHIDEESSLIKEGDLYCFEASLYKHWTDEFTSRRVFLSFGFMVPYEILGWDVSDPRIRLSERIQRYFQKL